MFPRYRCSDCGAEIRKPEEPCSHCLFDLGLDSPETNFEENFAALFSPEALSPEEVQCYSFGDYELLDRLGRGGMGIVFKAYHTRLDREVAIKFIAREHLTASPEARQRFEIEAAATANLDHPNIVPAYEVGDYKGHAYLCMKLIAGPDLAKRIRQGTEQPLTLQESATLMAKISHAVHHAHSNGILHRDLKPSNILIDSLGEPHVMDFGLAKFTDDRAGDLTRSLTTMGTPHYMAPEQCQGIGRFTTASEVFALGVILHEMLTGAQPFGGDGALSVMHEIVEQETPPVVGLDAGLDAIRRKCLEKQPNNRYASAKELASDLQNWITGEPLLAQPPTTTQLVRRFVRKHRAVVLSTASAILALFAATAISIHSSIQANQAEEETRDTFVRSDLSMAQEVLDNDKPSLAVAHICRALRTDPNNRVAANKLLATLAYHSFQPQVLPPMEHESQVRTAVFFDRDTKILTGCDDGTVSAWDARDGTLIKRLGEFQGRIEKIKVSGDHTMLATPCYDGKARVWNARTLELVSPVFEMPGTGWFCPDVSFSPNSKSLLTVHLKFDGQAYNGFATVWKLPSGQQHFAVPLRHSSYPAAAFSPDGKVLVTGSTTVQLWDIESAKLLKTSTENDGPVSFVCFAGNDRVLTSERGARRVIQTWDRHTFEKRGPHLWPTYPQYQALLDGPGRRIAFQGPIAYLMDVESWLRVGPGVSHGRNIFEIEFSQDSNLMITKGIASAPGDTAARIWETATTRPVSTPIFHKGGASAGKLNSTSTVLLTGGREKRLRAWDIRSHRSRPIVCPQNPGAWKLSFNTEGSQLTSIGLNGHLSLADSTNGLAVDKAKAAIVDPSLRHDFRSHGTIHWARGVGPFLPDWARSGQPKTAAFSPNGRLLAVGDVDGRARLWDLLTERQVEQSLDHDSGVTTLAFDSSGQRLLTGCQDGSLHLWDVASEKRLRSYSKIHTDAICMLHWPSDGIAATASEDGSARIIDLDTDKRSAHMRHQGPVRHLAVSASGRWLATGSADNSARVWNMANGQPITPPLRHEGITRGHGILVKFAKDDSKVISGASIDAAVRVWDLPSGNPSYPPLLHKSHVNSLTLSEDGSLLATTGDENDNHTYVWHLDTGVVLTPPLPHPRLGDQRFAINANHIILSAAFNSDGTRVASGSWDGTVQIWDIPAVDKVPTWLPDLGEVIVQLRLDKNGNYSVLDYSEIQTLRKQLNSLAKKPEVDADVRIWTEWLLSDPQNRPVTPRAKLTLEQLIQHRAITGDATQIRDALTIAPTEPRLMSALARQLAKQMPLTDGDIREAEYLAREAIKRAPENPNVKQACEETLKLLSSVK